MGSVSMPLNGLHPFLPEYRKMKYLDMGCINALKRASSISTNISLMERYSFMMCINALKRASSISTKHDELRTPIVLCINALKRASSISTLPFWKPLFIRL